MEIIAPSRDSAYQNYPRHYAGPSLVPQTWVIKPTTARPVERLSPQRADETTGPGASECRVGRRLRPARRCESPREGALSRRQSVALAVCCCRVLSNRVRREGSCEAARVSAPPSFGGRSIAECLSRWGAGDGRRASYARRSVSCRRHRAGTSSPPSTGSAVSYPVLQGTWRSSLFGVLEQYAEHFFEGAFGESEGHWFPELGNGRFMFNNISAFIYNDDFKSF